MKKKKKQQPIEKPRRRTVLYDPNLIVDYIIFKSNQDDINGITSLKTQILLFHIQSISLVMTGYPFIDCKFEAFDNGPFCRDIYERLGGEDMLMSYLGMDSVINENVASDIDEYSINFLDHIIDLFGDMDEIDLTEVAMDGKPFREALVKPGVKVISNKSMALFYRNEFAGFLFSLLSEEGAG